MNQNNFFTQQIQRYKTEEFVTLMKPEDIQTQAKRRLFREMVHGQIDYAQYGKYFLDNKFLSNLIIAANNELTNNTVTLRSLQFYDNNYPGDRDVAFNINKYAHLQFIYSTLSQQLMLLKNTSDIGVLTCISFVLKEHKKYINV